MKATINGVRYNTAGLQDIAMEPGNHEERLYRTKAGDFFIHRIIQCVDGRELAHLEAWPLDCDGLSVVDHRGIKTRRLSLKESIVPLSRKEAMIWIVKTQIPETFRGYFLDCI
jgi:hypothetical protein